MKRKSFALSLLLVGLRTTAFAVWPPTTSLEEPANQAPSSKSFDNQYRSAPRPRGIFDRLDDDQRRLKGVLQDLENDTKDLKQSTITSGVKNKRGEY